MLEWNKSYEIGNRFIDSEHKILFEIANDVSANGLDTIEAFKGMYLDLMQYMNLHFHNEEAVLKDIGYSHVATHQNSHHAIMEEMRQLVQHAGGLASVKVELEGCLQRWIVNHIVREDMAYKPFYLAWRKKLIAGK